MTNPKIATALTGLAMIVVALIAGAYFGALTSPDAPPAHAQIIEKTSCVFCTGTSHTGSAGNVGDTDHRSVTGRVGTGSTR